MLKVQTSRYYASITVWMGKEKGNEFEKMF